MNTELRTMPKTGDWRNLAAGSLIATPGMKYCDQPYPVCLADGTWLCMLTVGTLGENTPGTRNFTAITLSADQGETWSPFALCNAQAYGVPLVTPDGRIYALTPHLFTFSDDGGVTWSEQYVVPAYPQGWSGWSVGMPLKVGDLAYLPWARIALPHPPRRTEVYFLRSDNLLTEKDPARLRWEMIPTSGGGLKGPDWDQPEHRSEEPHIVSLSDGTLYTVFRTDQGYIAYARSRDAGDSWSAPQVLTYEPGGSRPFKHPLACPSLWACGEGRYLLFFHNHSGTTYAERNPAWISGGVEVESEIRWSEPEILLYSDDLTYDSGRISYPGFLQQDGRYWIFETQKTLTRFHEIPAGLFTDLWQQGTVAAPVADGVVLTLSEPGDLPESVPMPLLPRFRESHSNVDRRRGFSLDLWLDHRAPLREQRLLDNRTEAGEGLCLTSLLDGSLVLTMNDGQTENRWTCRASALRSTDPAHIVVTVDGGPKTICFVVNGQLWDGGREHQYGWGRFSPNLQHVHGSGILRIGPDAGLEPSGGSGSAIRALRVYARALRTSEAVANFRAGEKVLS
jgi:hypothetical protein